MKTTDKFDYPSSSGEFVYRNCNFAVNRYRNGNLALIIENKEEGEIAVCSVNGDKICGKDEIGIKAWSENTGMDDFLERMGIIGELTDVRSSGFVNILYYKLTESGKELFKNLR